MSIERYQDLLTKRDKLIKKMTKLSSERDFLLDGLDVLSDEEGSDRWNNKRNQLDKVEIQIDRYTKQLKDVETQLNL